MPKNLAIIKGMYNEGDKKNQMGVLWNGILNSKGNLLSVGE